MEKKEQTRDEEIIRHHHETLVSDLMYWIQEPDFQPPFPYNTMWPNKDERDLKYRLSVLKEAIIRLEKRTEEEEKNLATLEENISKAKK